MSQPVHDLHVPPPKVPCFRCKKSHDTAAAFLISCSKCERAWHHTCHIPPVTEEEILGRIDADKKGKRDAGLGGWQCRTCTKRSRTEPSSRPDLLNEGSAPLVPTLALKAPQTLQNSSTAMPALSMIAPTVITIDDEDDDDVMSLDEPPRPVSKLATKLVQPPTQKKTAGQAHGGQLPAVVNFSGGAESRRSLPQAPTSIQPVPGVIESTSLPATMGAPAPTQGKSDKGKEKERVLLTSYSRTPASLQSAAAQSSAPSQSQEKGKGRTVTKIAKRASEQSRPAPFSLPAATHGYGTGGSRSSTGDSVTLPSPPTAPIRPPSPKPWYPLPLARHPLGRRPCALQ
ncbi:hypothetical protein C8Q74DRAFT_853369 [Fomes fomentarius]|nr:hypothetical protein C8Q74DRAFT_853369 [Fomes fomentarius]